MKTKFRGKEYRIIVRRKLRGCYGKAESPNMKNAALRFERSLFSAGKRRRLLLEILIHEALHACFWDMDEEAIDRAGRDVARFLKKMGVRVPAPVPAKPRRRSKR